MYIYIPIHLRTSSEGKINHLNAQRNNKLREGTIARFEFAVKRVFCMPNIKRQLNNTSYHTKRLQLSLIVTDYYVWFVK